jgi:DNA-binding response OmpR family regulator
MTEPPTTTDTAGAPRVLLAEDDEALRTFLAELLRDDGYDVVEVSDGRQLFWVVETALRTRPIDVVVSDLRMPAYNGLDVVEAWAHAGTGPKVVLMSAFPDHEVRRRAESLGVALLEKPFDVGRLRDLVRTLVSRAGGPPDAT